MQRANGAAAGAALLTFELLAAFGSLTLFSKPAAVEQRSELRKMRDQR
jgi:hypothetical protein